MLLFFSSSPLPAAYTVVCAAGVCPHTCSGPQLEDVAKTYCDSKCETYVILMPNVLIDANF